MDHITIKIKKLEKRDGKGKGCLAIYNLILEGTTKDNKSPAIKGIRLFESTKRENKKYIRMPQIPLRGGRYLNVYTLPEEIFDELEKEIVRHYEENTSDQFEQKNDGDSDLNKFLDEIDL